MTKTVNRDEEHLCGGAWSSKVNGQSDGFIVLTGLNTVTGNFAGLHFVPDGPFAYQTRAINGNCEHPGSGGGGAHFMQFRETTMSGDTFVYSGVIVPDNTGAGRHKIPNGKREGLFINIRDGRVEIMAGDPWEAEKTT